MSALTDEDDLYSVADRNDVFAEYDEIAYEVSISVLCIMYNIKQLSQITFF